MNNETFKKLKSKVELTLKENLSLKDLKNETFYSREQLKNKDIDFLHWDIYLYFKSKINLLEWPEDLQKEFLKLSWKWEQYEKSYKDIKLIFSKNQIPFVPLKGIWLGQKIYPHVALREFGDLDIWVQKKYYKKAYKALVENKYFIKNKWHGCFHFNHLFIEKPLDLKIELHKSLSHFDFTRINSNEIWNAKVAFKSPFEFELSVEDQLIYILYHSAIHGFDRYTRILDCLLVMNWALNLKVNKKRLLEKCTKWQCRRLFLTSVKLIEFLTQKEYFSKYFSSKDNLIVDSILNKYLSLKSNHYTQPRFERIKTSDNLTSFVRGITHPKRIIGASIDRLFGH